jgi:hypothetical protein
MKTGVIRRWTLGVERSTFRHFMRSFSRASIITVAAVWKFAAIASAQTPDTTQADSVRVNVTLNADGSRTAYQFDTAHHTATATTTGRDGKSGGKIQYQLDQAGRFESGRIFGPDGKFRFKSLYKYDEAGRLQEETQLTKDGAVISKIVYTYDSSGKTTGYSIFDGAGKLLGRTSSPTPSPPASPKSRKAGQ